MTSLTNISKSLAPLASDTFCLHSQPSTWTIQNWSVIITHTGWQRRINKSALRPWEQRRRWKIKPKVVVFLLAGWVVSKAQISHWVTLLCSVYISIFKQTEEQSMWSGDGDMKWWGSNLFSASGLQVNLKIRISEKSEEWYYERAYKTNPDTPIEGRKGGKEGDKETIPAPLCVWSQRPPSLWRGECVLPALSEKETQLFKKVCTTKGVFACACVWTQWNELFFLCRVSKQTLLCLAVRRLLWCLHKYQPACQTSFIRHSSRKKLIFFSNTDTLWHWICNLLKSFSLLFSLSNITKSYMCSSFMALVFKLSRFIWNSVAQKNAFHLALV